MGWQVELGSGIFSIFTGEKIKLIKLRNPSAPHAQTHANDTHQTHCKLTSISQHVPYTAAAAPLQCEEKALGTISPTSRPVQVGEVRVEGRVGGWCEGVGRAPVDQIQPQPGERRRRVRTAETHRRTAKDCAPAFSLPLPSTVYMLLLPLPKALAVAKQRSLQAVRPLGPQPPECSRPDGAARTDWSTRCCWSLQVLLDAVGGL